MRHLLAQPGPRAVLGARSVTVSSELVEIEVLRVLERAAVHGIIEPGNLPKCRADLGGLLSTIHLLPAGDEVLERAREPFAFPVTVMQSMHVATALIVRAEAPDLELWTHVPGQANAALARGLIVRGLDVGRS